MRKIKRDKFVLLVSFFIFLLAIEVRVYSYYDALSLNTSYESFDIKNMASTTNSYKSKGANDSLSSLFYTGSTNYSFHEIIKQVEALPVVAGPFWHLPTEMGTISQNPHYSHMALDITSPRGSGEVIYPVADGVISGIYTDPNGALVVTILHDYEGKKYTSQYAHLSRFQEGIYVGKSVSYLDPIGMMGTTGYSTGVHLHLAVLDCALFSGEDPNCYDLNHFFAYGNRRVLEGYLGLGSHIVVPGSWVSRNS